MKLEQKKALGRLLRQCRESRNWSQEDVVEQSGVNLRTIQRAEVGEGIGMFNLGILAKALGVEVGELKRKAVSSGPPPPDKRIQLKLVRAGSGLVQVLEQCTAHGWSLEVGPPGEHPYNDMVGEDIIALVDELEKAQSSEKERMERVRYAQGIVSFSRKMGLGLFAGNYTQEFTVEKRRKVRKATLIIAAPIKDPRIVKTAKGPVLDVVRDSRRPLLGGLLAGHTTMYNWVEDQLISKSDGEFRVKELLGRIMSEVMEEIILAGKRAKSASDENV